jgi:hypothetical protein
MKLVNILYNVHILPQLAEIAKAVNQAIVKKRITVLAVITSGIGSEYEYGSYAVAEAWADLDEVIQPFFNYRETAMTGSEYVELIDLLVDDLKSHKFIYLEW